MDWRYVADAFFPAPPPPLQPVSRGSGGGTPPPPDAANKTIGMLMPVRRAAVDVFGGDALAERIIDGAMLVLLVVCAAKAGARLLASISAVADHLLRVLVAGLATTLFVRLALAAYASFCNGPTDPCNVSALFWSITTAISGTIDAVIAANATTTTTP